MESVYKKVDRTVLSEKVEDELQKIIAQLGLKPGDSLPGEIELARRFGVSRNVVREALIRLKTKGVLKTTKKRGITLCEPDWVGNFSGVLNLIGHNDESWRELAEIRVIVELGIAEYVYLRKTPDLIRVLEKIVDEEEKDAASQSKSRESDIKFHSALYKIVSNNSVERFQHILREALLDPRAATFHPDRFQRDDIVSHRDIVESLKSDSSMEFVAKLHKHFAGVVENTQKVYAEAANNGVA